MARTSARPIGVVRGAVASGNYDLCLRSVIRLFSTIAHGMRMQAFHARLRHHLASAPLGFAPWPAPLGRSEGSFLVWPRIYAGSGCVNASSCLRAYSCTDLPRPGSAPGTASLTLGTSLARPIGVVHGRVALGGRGFQLYWHWLGRHLKARLMTPLLGSIYVVCADHLSIPLQSP